MRWNAIRFGLCTLFVFPLGGCATWHKIFGKKQADGQNLSATMDSPMTANFDEPAPSYEKPTARYHEPDRDTDVYAGYESSPLPVRSGREALAGRYHVVAKRDTLYGLARIYYNDASRWKDIYEANRSGISDPNKIRIGQRLVIP